MKAGTFVKHLDIYTNEYLYGVFEKSKNAYCYFRIKDNLCLFVAVCNIEIPSKIEILLYF